MNFSLSLEMYCGLLLLMVVLDLLSFTKNKDKATSRYKNKYAKVGVVASYPVLGIGLTIFNVFPPITALAPALVASAVVAYVLFIKYNK